MGFDIYEHITNNIVEAMEAGAGQWVMPWHRASSLPVNASTGKAYSGVNVLNLWIDAALAGFSSGEWATFKQWKAKGAKVKPGSRASKVVFYKKVEWEDDDGEDRASVVLRYSPVFNADQVEGYTPAAVKVFDGGADALAAVDQYVADTGADIRYGGGRACYIPSQDMICMPERKTFFDTKQSTATASFYSTQFHELTHWTGAKSRLDRNLRGRFGDESYAMEELVAELGAAFACAMQGVTAEPRADHASYLANWLQVLKNDKRAIFTAAAKARDAAEYMNELVEKKREKVAA